MPNAPDNYEKVSIYPIDEDVREKLLSTQIECVFNWATREGWPMGVIMSCYWKNWHVSKPEHPLPVWVFP